MDALLKWLSENPLVTNTLLFALSGLAIVIAILYVVAFFQGRDVSFWPPHIGHKPKNSKSTLQRDDQAKPGVSKLEISHPTSFLITSTELESIEPIINLIGHSDDLLLAGVALGFAAQRHRSQLLTQIEKGARLRFLVLDPNSSDIDAMAKMFEVPSEQIRDDIRVTLRDLDVLKEKAKTLRSGLVEVRLLLREPSFSFAISNPKSPSGYFSAGLRLYGQRSTTRPYFILKASDMWFHLFVDSCENLWNDSPSWPRDKETLKPISQRAGVVAYRLKESSEVEILLITARINPQKWIFPVGMVDSGESLQQTAARECAEESGFSVEVGPKLGRVEFDEGTSINRMNFFIARVTGELENYETDRQRKWVQLSELAKIVAPDFLPIARAAEEKLRN